MNYLLIFFIFIGGAIAILCEKIWMRFSLETRIAQFLNNVPAGPSHVSESGQQKQKKWQLWFFVEFVLFALLILFYIKYFSTLSDTTNILFAAVFVVLAVFSVKIRRKKLSAPSTRVMLARIIKFIVLFLIYCALFLLWRLF